MKIIIISSFAVIREGIAAIISKLNNISIMFVGETMRDAAFMIKSNMIDIIVLDIHADNVDELNIINEIVSSGKDVKTIILDFNNDDNLFMKALKCGVQGYVSGKSNEDEILYVLDQVHKGKKYFDSYFIDYVINNNNLANKLELLTIREREILIEIAKGRSNRKISEKFLITENTVKKHISHIFNKLNITDRSEAVLYANSMRHKMNK